MKDSIIKVIWICHFSNKIVRENVRFKRFSLLSLFLKLVKRNFQNRDFAIWITNGIKYFEKYSDIQLTVVFPHQGAIKGIQKFNCNGVQYICFHSEDDNFLSYIMQHVFKVVKTRFSHNCDVVNQIIEEVNPDIVHVIGAENPYYSITALNVPERIPTIVSLQTLLNVKGFKDNYKINKSCYEYRALLERKIIQKCDYIATGVPDFVNVIRETIKPNVQALKLKLAVGVDVDFSFTKKEYDFVYFASNINKACDVAIEAFALAKKKHPHITMNVSGRYTLAYKNELERRMKQLNILGSVFFTGSKDTHEEVIEQIKKSKFALLPFKVDQMPSTIREAMACGLPVVSFSTPAMEQLNSIRESILLVAHGNISALAFEMTRLLDDPKLANRIRKNAGEMISELYSNDLIIEQWRKAYKEITSHQDGAIISESVLY